MDKVRRRAAAGITGIAVVDLRMNSMSAYAGTDSTLLALRHRAYDFLRKPVSVDEFSRALERAFDRTRLVADMRQAEHAVCLSEEKFSKAFLRNPDPISITALDDGVMLDINDAYEVVTGYSRAGIVGRVSGEFGLWVDPQARRAMLTRLEAGTSVDRQDSVFRRKNGELIFAQVSAEVVEISGRRCTIVHARDTTAEKQAAMALAESEERFRSLYHATPSIFFALTADCIIKSVNSFGASHLGYATDDLTGESILGLVAAESRVTIRQSISECFSQPGTVREWEIQFLYRNGDVRWLRQSANAVRDTNGVSELLLASEDMTNAKHLSEQLNYQASHDSLTGLVNRREFERRLERALQTATRDNTHSVLCCLDLDRFKEINDTCGHIDGDDLLRQVTAVLQSVVRKRDTLARLGGDEFAILLEEVLVKNIMAPKTKLQAVTRREVLKSSVGDVMHTLRTFSGQHILVVDGHGDAMQICGMFPAAEFKRALGVTFELPATAHTFADLERMIHELKEVI